MIQQGMKHTSDQRRCGIATSELRSHKKITHWGRGSQYKNFFQNFTSHTKESKSRSNSSFSNLWVYPPKHLSRATYFYSSLLVPPQKAHISPRHHWSSGEWVRNEIDTSAQKREEETMILGFFLVVGAKAKNPFQREIPSMPWKWWNALAQRSRNMA